MKRSLSLITFLFVIGCALVGTTQAQLTVQNNLTPNELVNNILV